MNYAEIKYNDIVNGEGICVSFWVQGCNHHCHNCFNKETWNPEGGKPFTKETMKELLEAISSNGIIRNLSLLGGDPLFPSNRQQVADIIQCVRQSFPHITIYLWTGYTLQQLLEQNDALVSSILKNVDVLIDGLFIESEKDLTLKLRGSKNQHIYRKKNDEWILTNN